MARGSDEVRALRRQLEDTNRAMWALYKDLDDRNAELDRFALIASHDLKEPLRRVRASAGRLEADCGDGLGARGREHVREIRDSVERMLTLIESLLGLARVSSEARPFEVTDLDEVADQVVADLAPRIEEARATLQLGDLPEIEGDRLQLHQLLQNLIGNALKFRSPERAPVVRVASAPVADGRCRILVADNGIGFDPRHADRLLQPFRRLHGSRSFEGVGIGLAICDRIARRHGGTIALDSVPERGTTVTVTLPLRQLPRGAGQAPRGDR